MNKTNKKNKIIEDDIDEHETSNDDNDDNNENIEENEEENGEGNNDIDENFKAAAIKFIKLDDMLADKKKKKREMTMQINEEIKTINEGKKKTEAFLVDYLEKIKKTQVRIDDDDALEKKEKIKRKPINADMIKNVFQDEIVKKKIMDSKKGAKFAEEIVKIIDESRTISKENVICRKTKRQKQPPKKK